MKPLRILCLAAALGLFASTAYPQAAVRFDSLGRITDPVKIPSTKAVVSDSALAALSTPGAAVYFTGSAWALSRADALGTARVDAIVESVSGSNVVLVYAGEMTLSGLTAGAPYYLSSTTAGARTTTPPTAAGTYRTSLFTAVSATKGIVKLSPDLVSNNLLGEADIDTSIARAAALAAKQDALSNATTIAKIGESGGLPRWDGSAWPGTGGVGGGMAPGSIFFWDTDDIANRPIATLLCDGTNGTKNLTNPAGLTYLVQGNGETVATPTFNPPAGTYTSTQIVTISNATSGSTVRYTTDGSTPSRSVGTVYSAPVTVSASSTLNAIAYKKLSIDSTVGSASYAIVVGDAPIFGGVVSCTAPGGANSRWQETADGPTEISIATAVAAGSRVVVTAVAVSETMTLASAADGRGNTYAVDIERRANTNTYVAIISSRITTPLQSGDVITLTWGGDAYSFRQGNVTYIANTVAGAADATGSADTYNSAISVAGTTTAATALIGILVDADAARTYSGGSWTTIGAYQDYGSRRVYFLQHTANAGAQDPAGSFDAPATWGAVWAAYK